ncbi:MAG TPA: transglycosylase SLT domain-containing protein [Beijerinckiaceae bacterium]
MTLAALPIDPDAAARELPLVSLEAPEFDSFFDAAEAPRPVESGVSPFGALDATAFASTPAARRGVLRFGGDRIRLEFDEESQTYAFGPMRLKHDLVETILRAAYLADVDPRLLMAIADKESSFVVGARASTSSATGLFQFIDSTWLLAVRDYGARYGLEAEAGLVEMVDGQPNIRDEAARARVLDMRRDAFLSTLLAASMLKREQEKLQATMGRAISEAEIYLVHFLGPAGAQKFLSALAEKPAQSAANLLPSAARANKPIFFNRQARKAKSLSVAQVHGKIEESLERRLMRYRGLDFVTQHPLARSGEGALRGWDL